MAQKHDWRPTLPAVEYGQDQLRALRKHHEQAGTHFSSEAEAQMLIVLRQITGTQTVYPSISIDEDGAVVAEWRWGNKIFEACIEPDLTEAFEVRVRGQRPASLSGRVAARRLLEIATLETEAANPRWRSLFKPVNQFSSRD